MANPPWHYISASSAPVALIVNIPIFFIFFLGSRVCQELLLSHQPHWLDRQNWASIGGKSRTEGGESSSFRGCDRGLLRGVPISSFGILWNRTALPLPTVVPDGYTFGTDRI